MSGGCNGLKTQVSLYIYTGPLNVLQYTLTEDIVLLQLYW